MNHLFELTNRCLCNRLKWSIHLEIIIKLVDVELPVALQITQAISHFCCSHISFDAATFLHTCHILFDAAPDERTNGRTDTLT